MTHCSVQGERAEREAWRFVPERWRLGALDKFKLEAQTNGN